MNGRAIISDIRGGLRSQPGRLALSFFAIAIGIASLSVLVAVLDGLNAKSRRLTQEFGANVVAILRQADNRAGTGGSSPGLQDKHLALLRAGFPDCAIAGVRRYTTPGEGNGQSLTVVATDSQLLQVRQWRLASGRFLDAGDVGRAERHAVISRRLGEGWGRSVGDTILLRHTPFTVVGTVDIGGSSIESEPGDPGLMLGDRVVFVPMTVRPDWSTERWPPGPGLDGLFMRVADWRSYDATVAQARCLMAQPDYHVSAVSWITPDTLIRGVRRLQSAIRLTMGGISLLCLVLGGITMMSLMIANVRQRVTEIGLRRALGARPRDIAALFVAEALTVTLIAGVAGTAAGHLLLALAGDAGAIPVSMGWRSALLPLIAALILGVTFSYWPARVAAAIAPSEALRND